MSCVTPSRHPDTPESTRNSSQQCQVGDLGAPKSPTSVIPRRRESIPSPVRHHDLGISPSRWPARSGGESGAVYLGVPGVTTGVVDTLVKSSNPHVREILPLIATPGDFTTAVDLGEVGHVDIRARIIIDLPENSRRGTALCWHSGQPLGVGATAGLPRQYQ